MVVKIGNRTNLFFSWGMSFTISFIVFSVFVLLYNANRLPFYINNLMFFLFVYIILAMIQSIVSLFVVFLFFRLQYKNIHSISIVNFAILGFIFATLPWIIVLWPPDDSLVQIGDEILVLDGQFTSLGFFWFMSEMLAIGVCGSIFSIVFYLISRKF